MASVLPDRRSLLEKVQERLEVKPDFYDVSFYVGPDQTLVKGVRLFLEAASPVFITQFAILDSVVVDKPKGIGLPDFDTQAFELFIELTMLDEWTCEALEKRKLEPNQVLNLLTISRHYEMRKEHKKLNDLLNHVLWNSFDRYKETEDFVQLSQEHLGFILASNYLPLTEKQVSDCAFSWAEINCKTGKEDAHRLALGDIFFNIRFPLMSESEFLQHAQSKYHFTKEESDQIIEFIRADDYHKAKTILAFCTVPRVANETPVGRMQTLHLTRNTPIVDDPSFVCDGSEHHNHIVMENKITLYGIGFLGPVSEDAEYNVTVRIQRLIEGVDVPNPETIEKRIFAKKGKTIGFLFEKPIKLQTIYAQGWKYGFNIYYSLKGPDTQSYHSKTCESCIIPMQDNNFFFQRRSNQMAEIIFRNL